MTPLVHSLANPPSEFLTWLAGLSSAGVLTWLALILIDTVIGLILRTGNNGKFDWAYIKHFLLTNFATNEAKVMGVLVGSAVASALMVHVSAGQEDILALFNVVLQASLLAFVGAVATQDAALIKDIQLKLAGQSSGQQARLATANKAAESRKAVSLELAGHGGSEEVTSAE